mmetsp:Transcript_17743/g.22632  ORF Transcript_17743/g.22632 Transcript_17743/m.22632 type:complete len:485 (-) Transcript_17743:287-1741(-)
MKKGDIPVDKSARGLIGEIKYGLGIVTSLERFVYARFEKYGESFFGRFFGQTCLFIAGDHALKAIATKDAEEAGISPWISGFTLRALLGDGAIIYLVGEDHEKYRNLLREYTAGDALHRLAPIITSKFKRELASWVDKTDYFDAYKRLKKVAFELNCLWMLGEDADKQLVDDLHDAVTTINAGLYSIPIKMPFTAYGKAHKARRKFNSLITQEIHRRTKLKHPNSQAGSENSSSYSSTHELSQRNDVLQRLMMEEDCGRLSRARLLDLFVSYMFAAVDTTSSLLSHCLEFASENYEVVARIRDECQGNPVWDFDSENIEASYFEHCSRKQLPYTHVAIMELLRFARIVTVNTRETVKEFTFFSRSGTEVTLPRGTLIALHFGYSMKNSDRFLHPEKVEPERFLRDRCEDRDNPSYCPFGYGNRACIGKPIALLEARIFMALLSNYIVLLKEKPNWKVSPAKVPEGGLHVRLVSRQGASQDTSLL